MSHRLTSLVWKYAPYSGTRLLVLLALADAANPKNGDRCWPPMPDLARKARCGEAWVGKHLAVLETDGWISRKRRWHDSTLYHVRCPIISEESDDAEDAENIPDVSAGNEDDIPDVSAGYSSTSDVSAGYIYPADSADIPRLQHQTYPAAERGSTDINRNLTVNRTVTRAPARETPSLSLTSTLLANEVSDAQTEAPQPPPPDVASAPPPPTPPAPAGAIRSSYASALVTWYRTISRMSFAPDMTRAQMDSWIRPLKFVSLIRADGRYTLTLAAPGSAARDQVMQRYAGLISNTCGACLNAPGVELYIASGAEATALLAEAQHLQQAEQQESQEQQAEQESMV